MNFKTFIGVDISKNTIDIALKQYESQVVGHRQFLNDKKGFSIMLNWIRKQTNNKIEDWVFCMEHTGVYVLPLACFLTENKLCFCLENPYHIKHSMGLQRGKSDKADSQMIARYASMHREELKLSNFPGQLLLRLQALLAHRDRLVQAQKGFKIASGELSDLIGKQTTAMIRKDTESLIKRIVARIKKAEEQINNLMQEDALMHKNYELAKSVIGIGPIIAAYMIVYTKNFTSITESRKFASYSGIAPFEYRSGTSIKRGNSVSHLANKKMKSLLNNGAWNAAKFDRELHAYFDRKVAEGKSKLSVINAVRNKIVGRVFAVVKRGTPFVQILN